MTGRPINEDRQNAIELGLMTYIGKKHLRCGTTERYASGGACVHCARIIATEQREARKFLQRQREAPLDTAEEMVLEEPDVPDAEPDDEAEAHARFLESVEDLM